MKRDDTTTSRFTPSKETGDDPGRAGANERPRTADTLMVLKVDSDGRIVDLNPASASHLGYSADELREKPVRWLYHSDDHAALRSLLKSCLAGPKEVHRAEFRKVRKDGTLVWVEEFAQSMREDSGAPYVQIVCRDVTEQQQAAQVREQLIVQLDAIVDNITEGVVISDLQGNVLSMNPAALAMHQLSGLQDVRRQLSEFTGQFELAELDGRVLTLSEWPLARALRGERFTDLEVRVRRKDLGMSWIWSYSGTPVRIREGEPILSVITMRDITARKTGEEALRLSEQRLRTIFETVPALLLISRAKTGIVVDVNGATLHTLGYRREEVVGHTVQEINLWEDLEDRARILKILQQHGSIQNLELRFRKKSGELITGLLSAEIIELEGEQCLFYLVKDITDRKQVEEEVARLNRVVAARAAELEEINKELEAFSYSVAHDLRRPLNVINGYCQTMQEACGANLGADCREYLEETYQATLRMNTLISALLDFSRLARVEPKRRRVDLSEMARQLARELQRAGGDRRVRFLIEEGMSVNADYDLMQVVLENLIGNAWKFTGKEEEGVIEVGMVQGAEQSTCFVRDNGAGFDMADAGKLFLPFQRLAAPEEFKGSGIGLATVERVIHRHGGKIWAEGSPGAGATFYFTLGE